MAGMHDGGIGELQELVFERGDDFVVGATPKVGATDAAGEKRVAGKELRLAQAEIAAVIGQIERHAAGAVAGCVNDAGEKIAPLEDVAFFEQLVNFDKFR